MAEGLLYQLTETHAHPWDEPGVEAQRDIPLLLRLYSLHRRQWVVLVAVALTIIVVNKGVIHDQGNNWFSLGMDAFFVGLVAAHLAGRVGLTPRVGREQPAGSDPPRAFGEFPSPDEGGDRSGTPC